MTAVTQQVMPELVECSECGQMRRICRRKLVRHSTYPTGPQCVRSGQLVTEEELAATWLRIRSRTVLHWAQVLRDEDPNRVLAWIARTPRPELETLMMLALAAIRENLSESQAFGWTQGWAQP